MEHIIFLHSDQAAWDVLRQIQQSAAQGIVLVIPPHLEQLRLNMLLRLIRRHTAGQSQRLVVISKDRLVQVLAERLGCMVAATLDEYHGLLPGYVASPAQSARQSHPTSRARHLHQGVIVPPEEKAARAAPTLPSGERLKTQSEQPEMGRPSSPQTTPVEQSLQGERRKPSANLDTILVDGYLPNPGATPGLDEAEELTTQDAGWLSYEITDERHPDQAQREAAAHESLITANIRKTSASNREDTPPTATPPQTGTPDTPAEPSSNAPKLPEQGRQLRPMRSIDELIHEHGHAEPFEWLAAQAVSPPPTPTSSVDASGSTAATEQIKPQGQSAPIKQRDFARQLFRQIPLRQRNQRPPDHKTLQINASTRPPWTAALTLRRLGIVFILAISLLMTGIGLALLPSAQVSYHVAIESYSETLTLDAQPGPGSRTGAAQNGTFVPAVAAQFDGVLSAQTSATGHQTSTAGNSQQAVPTQSDVDQAAGILRERLKALGQSALLAQIHSGDIAGPVFTTEQILALPSIGTPLPSGISAFQVSLALHLRQVVVRQQTLQQAVWTRMNKDVAQDIHGFTLASGQKLALNVVTGASSGAGTDLPGLRLFIHAGGAIVPALTPDQARAAIAGMSVDSAESYLRQQPGISAVSIVVLPNWLNRLPIFSARIRIKLES